jgi:allantoinase
MTFTKAIFSKRVILPEGTVPATLLIESGKIAKVILDKLPSTKELPVRNLGDSVIMPGLIDCHVHINEPGRTDWEGFDTATAAAAAGGITTLVDMPLNSSPVTTNTTAFTEKLLAAKDKILVNCGFWGGIVPSNIDQLEPLIKAGVLGFKVFLTHSGIDEFPNTPLKKLEKSLPLLAQYNLPLLVHAELDSPHNDQSLLEEDNYSYQAYLASRPKKWEDEAIHALIKLCEKYRVRIHIVHLSSADALEAIRAARKAGLPLTVETCPHYLYFSAEKINDGDTRFKCAPPIRDAENNQQLWDALVNGDIDFIATDHSPAPPEIKELNSGNLKEAWGGISSLQFSLPVIWTLAQQRKSSLDQVSKWMSKTPADFLGLTNKGCIREGADADLVIWSPEKKMKVSPANIKFRHKATPYEGEMLSGVVEETWVSGEIIYDRGAFNTLMKGSIVVK